MNILFTVCCRAGSKSIKNKNLKLFLGTPLSYYTLASIKLYKQEYGAQNYFTTCLNTDSEELISQVLEYDSDIQIVHRDEALAGDTVPKVVVIKDCLQKTEAATGIIYDIVVDLDVTSPLRRVKDIHAAICKKQKRDDIDIVFSVTSPRRNPYFNMVKTNSDDTVSRVIESDYSTRQQAPVLFDMNASIYVYGVDFLHKSVVNSLFDGRCNFIEMVDTAVLDIDKEEDFKLMEILAEHFYKTDSKFGEIAQEAKR